jgi:hypothetical protein
MKIIVESYKFPLIWIRVVFNYFNEIWAQVQGLNLILDTFSKILQKVSAPVGLFSF